MLSPLKDLLKDCKIVLTSSSKARKEMFEQAGIEPIIETHLNEVKLHSKNVKSISEITEHLSSITSTMAFYIARKYEKSSQPVVVVSPASVIVAGPKTYGIPLESVLAKEMLEELVGFTHQYITGVYLVFCGNLKPGDKVDRRLWKEKYFESRTLVKLKNLDSNMIDEYLKMDEPFDQVGAYDVNKAGIGLVEWVQGDYNNLRGLPLFKLCSELRKLLEKNLEKL